MPDDSKKFELVIDFDPATGAFACRFPVNVVIALGMLEYARESLMEQRIRPGMRPQVEIARKISGAC